MDRKQLKFVRPYAKWNAAVGTHIMDDIRCAVWGMGRLLDGFPIYDRWIEMTRETHDALMDAPELAQSLRENRLTSIIRSVFPKCEGISVKPGDGLNDVVLVAKDLQSEYAVIISNVLIRDKPVWSYPRAQTKAEWVRAGVGFTVTPDGDGTITISAKPDPPTADIDTGRWPNLDDVVNRLVGACGEVD